MTIASFKYNPTVKRKQKSMFDNSSSSVSVKASVINVNLSFSSVCRLNQQADN